MQTCDTGAPGHAVKKMTDVKIDRHGHRAVIKYLHTKGMSPKEIHEDMVATLEDSAPSYSMVKKWAAEFKRGRESLEDDPRSGRPVSASTKEAVDKIRGLLDADQTLTERRIAEQVGISQERVHAIIHNELGMTKEHKCWTKSVNSEGEVENVEVEK